MRCSPQPGRDGAIQNARCAKTRPSCLRSCSHHSRHRTATSRSTRRNLKRIVRPCPGMRRLSRSSRPAKSVTAKNWKMTEAMACPRASLTSLLGVPARRDRRVGPAGMIPLAARAGEPYGALNPELGRRVCTLCPCSGRLSVSRGTAGGVHFRPRLPCFQRTTSRAQEAESVGHDLHLPGVVELAPRPRLSPSMFDLD